MLILAIDTALEACSAALLDTEQTGLLVSETLPMVRGHAEALMPMIERVMRHAGREFAEVDRIAVTVGPGSFTGLRVGIAAGRGIALAASRPIVGLTTLAAYAAPLIADDDSLPVLAAVDARHRQVYMQVFGGGGRPSGPPRVATLHEAAQIATAPQARIIGSGADLVAAAVTQGAAQPIAVHQQSAPEILWVARLGAAMDERGAPPRPLYLRAPDAQPQDAARLPRR